MIRPFTCVCILLAGGSGLYLYQVKHRAQLLDREIARVQHQIDATHERTRLLRAEWALLNDPSRLQGLADQFLALKPMLPNQFVQMASLADRLPPPAAPGSAAPAPEDQAPVPVAEAPQPEPQTVASIAPAEPAQPPAPIAAASRPDAAAPSPEPALRKDVASAPAHADPVSRAERQPVSRVVASTRRDRPAGHETMQTASARPVAAPRPILAPVVPAVAETRHVQTERYAQSVTTREVAARAIQGLPVTAPVVGSALGVGRQMLAPPVPVGSSAFR